MQSNRKSTWLLWLLPLLFGVFVLILLQFRDVIYERFVVRLAEILWYAGIVLNSVSQELYWIVLLVIVLVTAFGTAVGLFLRAEADVPQSPPAGVRPVSRARHWTELIYVRAPIQYTRELMNNEVRGLLLNHLGFGEDVDRSKIEEMIQSGELDLPAEVVPYLSKRRHEWTRREKKRTGLRGYLFWLEERLNKRRDIKMKREPIDPQLESVVSYLESQLEVSDDTGQ
jgi:hypothetical protein